MNKKLIDGDYGVTYNTPYDFCPAVSIIKTVKPKVKFTIYVDDRGCDMPCREERVYTTKEITDYIHSKLKGK